MKSKFLYTLTLCTVLLSPVLSKAQGVSISPTNTNPDNSAMLDVSSTTKGMLIPRMDSLQRVSIISPAVGLLVYQTNGLTPGFYYRNATAWVSLSTPATTNASALTTGTLSDSRLSSTVTQQGNTFNGVNKLVQLNGTGALPALSASNLTNLNASNITSGTVPIANGGTGQSTAAAALNTLLPAQSGNNGKVLSTDGTNTSWKSASSTSAFNTTSSFTNGVAAGGPYYLNPLNNTAPVASATTQITSTGGVNGMFIPSACTLVAMRVTGSNYSALGTASNTVTMKVVVNGVIQAMQIILTIPSNAKVTSLNTTNTISLAAGDILSVTYQETNNVTAYDGFALQLYFQ